MKRKIMNMKIVKSIPLLEIILEIFISKNFFKFVIVGIISTIVNYSIFYYFLEYLIIGFYKIASAIGYSSGVFVGFFLNKYWTFEAKEKNFRREIPIYFTVYFFSLLIGLLFLEFEVIFLKINVLIANFLTIVLTTIMNFIGTKFIVFKK